MAFVGTHKHDMIRNEDRPYEFTLYMFRIGLDIPEGARQLVLPDDPRSWCSRRRWPKTPPEVSVRPATRRACANARERRRRLAGRGRRNLLYGKPVVERSGEVNASERAECATDEDVSTKWCDYSDAKPSCAGGGSPGRRPRSGVGEAAHAALEALDYITKEYSLQAWSPGEEENGGHGLRQHGP